ncbi:rRNA-processing protein UTP23 homolog [Sceloporus undulatus]|uniref:rRNA-processing protein UTP23 homolog n=1 Tax=Sceloporus undulatus TaxID=8520 RepID=UPI001C4D31E4|nr:rRNA-processing protein UTP23 homolog [Sceloporus undulatus]
MRNLSSSWALVPSSPWFRTEALGRTHFLSRRCALVSSSHAAPFRSHGFSQEGSASSSTAAAPAPAAALRGRQQSQGQGGPGESAVKQVPDRRTGLSVSSICFPFSFRCVLKELESLGKELYGAKLIAQRFQVRHCSHFQNPVSGSLCLLSMAEGGNPHHYFIATQDQDLATKIKKKAGIPLLFIIQNTIVLDKPSAKSLASVQSMQTNQLIPEHQKVSIAHLKEEQGLVKSMETKKRKRKRPAGPNPLSCLKKKKKGQETSQSSTTKRKANKKRSKRKLETTAGSGSQDVEA